jgi:hypothetical protein
MVKKVVNLKKIGPSSLLLALGGVLVGVKVLNKRNEAQQEETSVYGGQDTVTAAAAAAAAAATKKCNKCGKCRCKCSCCKKCKRKATVADTAPPAARSSTKAPAAGQTAN